MLPLVPPPTWSAALLKRLLPTLHKDWNDEREDGAYPIKDTVEGLCDDVLAQCAAAVANLKEAHNAGLPHARVPSEIWCLIWSLLPRQDSIVITHVCHAWRALAIDYAPLWTHIRFLSAVHEGGSSCNWCECQEAITFEQPWKNDTPQPIHNLGQVETLLGRSKGASITLEVCIYPVDSDLSLAVQLAEIVKPHARRIVSLVYVFGDVSFFVTFMQNIEQFPSLCVLHMRRKIYIDDEDNAWPWPMTKLQLEHLSIPRLREFGAYRDFWWDVPQLPLEARSLGALEHLRCNFKDAGSLYHCLRACPSLVILKAVLNDCPTTRLPAVTLDHENLGARLQDLSLDRMTPLWQAVVQSIIRRPELRMLTLRYIKVDTITTKLEAQHQLALAVQLSILGGLASADAVELKATDVHSRSRCLEFIRARTDDAQPTFNPLSHVWTYISVPHLRTLELSWVLRAVLLDGRIVAPGVSRIRLLVGDSDTDAQHGTDTLIVPNGATTAGKPSFPNLRVLEIVASTSDSPRKILPAASVKEFATALAECPIELVGVELQ